MSYISKMLVLLASLSLLTGCGLQQYARHTNIAGYPARHDNFDYKYAWKATSTDHGVVIEGYMKNVRYNDIESVDLTVFVLGKERKIVARQATFPMPQMTREGDVVHFSLMLRDIKPAPGDVYHFLVNYSNGEVGHWISSFKADAMTGAVIRPQSRNPDEW